MNVYSVTNASGEIMSKIDIDEMLKNMGISDEAIQGGEDAIEQEAEKQGIDLAQLSTTATKDGAKVNGSSANAKQDFDAQLKALGVPEATIEQGKDAVQAYAAANNIKLPESPSGTQLNIVS